MAASVTENDWNMNFNFSSFSVSLKKKSMNRFISGRAKIHLRISPQKLVSSWFHWTCICSAPYFETSCWRYGRCTKKSCSRFAGGRPVQNITPTWLVSNWLPVKSACLHLNSSVTDTDLPWVMSALAKLLLHMATVQGYPEVFYRASVKFRVFQYLICKIMGNSTATGTPNKSHKTC